jgi:hypothetical protein
MPLLQPALMPACAMKRVIVHWSAGAYRASALDKTHYHILVEGDGTIVAGTNAISSNAAPPREPRASHTLNSNTGSIGVAVCCMADARESPFNPGPFPMTRRQWDVLAEVVGELCATYQIEVTAATVLAHGEVEKTLGIKQRQKWDPLVLPWVPTMPRTAVMEGFRERVRVHLARLRGNGVMTIAEVQPSRTAAGTTVIILGSGFGSAPEGASVLFNGVDAAAIESWSDTEIHARVPEGIVGATKVEITLDDGTTASAAADQLSVEET